MHTSVTPKSLFYKFLPYLPPTIADEEPNFSTGVINYIVRYAGRPVLAQSRITGYGGGKVTFTYTPHGSSELVRNCK